MPTNTGVAIPTGEDEHDAMLPGRHRKEYSDTSSSHGVGLGVGISAAQWQKLQKPDFIALEINGDTAPSQQHTRNCPEEAANWLSRVTYMYVDALMNQGYKKTLDRQDLWDMARQDEASKVYKQFQTQLQSTKSNTAPQGVVWRALWRQHGRVFIYTGILKVFHDLVMFMPPYILERLLHHMTGGGSRLGAFGWACLLFAAAIVENISINIYFQALYRMSLHVKTEMIQMIYEKSLRITGAVKSEMGIGAIVNLQSNDASKIWNTPLYMHIVWNGPFQIFIVMAMLVRIMSWAPAMSGLGVTIIMIPLSTLLGRALASVRRKMMKQTDARVKLASEVITGIKAIKLYAWEDAYMERIGSLRSTELQHIWYTQILSMLNSALYSSGPVLVALAAFTVYSFMGFSLTAAVAFPALSLFNLLRFPIIMFPSQVMNMIHARVGLQRIQKFMQADEMRPRGAPPPKQSHNPFAVHADDDDAPLLPKEVLNSSFVTTNGSMTIGLRNPSSMTDNPKMNGSAAMNGIHDVSISPTPTIKPAIIMRNGSYSWEPGKEMVLKEIDLRVEPGQLVMVVGQVGSGKSSLLAALLGEMHRISGKVNLQGTIAYTAQDPWIQNSTLRNNVLMGKPYDEELYTQVLAACALAPDLEMLPAGDSTEIGEKGVNLSGGQKHRVALARAAYAEADVYLLDDPLSAVDAHVGRHLFDEAIGGFLAEKTRILVTHQLQYLPSADVVVLMADGGIKEIGSYQDLVARGVDLDQIVQKSEESEDDDKNPNQPSRSDTPYLEKDAASQQKPGLETPEKQVETLRHISHQNGYLDPLSKPSIRLINLDEVADQYLQPDADQPSPVSADDTNSESFKTPLDGSPLDANQPLPVDQQTPTVSPTLPGKHIFWQGDNEPENSNSPSKGLQNGHREQNAGVMSEMTRSVSRSELAAMKRAASQRNLAGLRESLRRTMQLKEQDGKIVKAEERAMGQVDKAIYRAYLSAYSDVWVLLPLAVVLLAFLERGLQVGQNYVLSFWTNDTSAAEKEGREPATRFWLTLYFTLGMLSIAMQMIRALALISGSISASRQLHNGLIGKLVRLPMSFFDSQPTGRLLNRLTKDTEMVDVQVSGSVNSALNCLVNAMLSIVVVSLVSPVALVALLPLSWVYWRVQMLYISTSRELKRLDALAFSPIFSHFSESLNGLPTIRAFNKQDHFMAKNKADLDYSNQAYWPIQIVNRWLSVRLEMMGAFIVFVTAVSVAVIMPSNSGLVGLAITSALNLTGIMNWMVRQMTELEVNMNSVERMVEYNKYEEEAEPIVTDNRPPASWPTEGAIEACDLSVRYRPELDPVLRHLSFKMRGREKVGVCGRTGCGKSTLIISLFRLIEPCGGTILIDGIDITKIGLKDLRSRLSLVPQDPVIFSGSIRSNLDPFSTARDDGQVWEALRRAGMDEYVKGLEGGLSAHIKEGGANLSVGQRQLLCMARALLRSSRILVLDEATSNVDNATDGLIQTTIRTAFADCTVLTIAHRLHTIIDSDRILVLDAGQLLEFDAPATLLQKPSSAFRKLVEETTKGGGLNAGAVAQALAQANNH